MPAIDGETAKRIALNLCDMEWVDKCRTTKGQADWIPRLANAIQEAAEGPEPKPGLYFVRDDAGLLHVQPLAYDEGRPQWLSWHTNGWESVPDGDILSGPHTCEELLEAVRK